MIDALVLAGESRSGASLSCAQIVESGQALGVARTLVAPALPADRDLDRANRLLAREVAEQSDVLSFVARVDPLRGDAIAQVERAMGELGAVGIFLHPAEECFPVRSAVPAVEAAASFKTPIIIAGGYYGVSEPLQVMELAHEYASVRFVITTGGQINISGLSLADAWDALAGAENLSVMTNGEYRQDFIERLVVELDDTRVLWGSFAPVYNRAFELQRIKHARIPDGSRRKVEAGNAQRLFGLDR